MKMAKKPRVLITRKLPQTVEDKLSENFDTILNPDDSLYSTDELLRLSKNVDAILPCHTEKFPADTIAALPAQVKAIANYSVGVDHVDLEAAKQKHIIVTNTPDVLSDATAEIAAFAGASVLPHDENQGKGTALNTGIQHARKLGPDAVRGYKTWQ